MLKINIIFWKIRSIPENRRGWPTWRKTMNEDLTEIRLHWKDAKSVAREAKVGHWSVILRPNHPLTAS